MLQTTRTLYDENPRETSFTATVLACEEAGGAFNVVLDQTQFFPEQGGQSSDKGSLAGQQVLDVKIKDGIILHKLAEPLEIGSQISGEVDWKHRFSNMQQHTGEHIFSGLVDSIYGYENVGFHLSDNIVTMDYSGPLTREQVRELELLANEKIWENLPVRAEFPSDEALEKMNYRSKKELSGPIRIVTIEGVDVCACCAPHVERTGEVGLLKVMSVEAYKGGVRLSILCGARALHAFGQDEAGLSEISGLLKLPKAELPAATKQLLAEKEGLRQRGQPLERRILGDIARRMIADGERIGFVEPFDVNAIRDAVNILTEASTGISGLFAGSDAEGYRFILGSNNIDCREAATALRNAFGAKGGGSAQMIQGSTSASREEIEKFVRSEFL